ncbi:MAG: hypothetical protein ABFD76_14665 [Smithella sp.]
MNAIVGAINLGGFVSTPRDYITTKLGLDKARTAWEFLRSKYAKHFGFGLEVRGSSPDFESTAAIRHSAMEAVDLALKHYGDMLIKADVQVKEGRLDAENHMVTGYDIDFSLDWDYSSPVLIEITYDRKNRSYRIMSMVFNHVIDGVPLALYTHLIHNHLVLGKASLLSQSKRTFPVSYKFHLWDSGTLPDKKGWLRLNCLGESDLFPIGSQIDVTDSSILKLRNKIALEIGQNVSNSSVEIALLSLEMGITWATDYIAQGDQNSKRQIDVQKGYRGLGIVRTYLTDKIGPADPLTQYQWICDAVKEAAGEMHLERAGKGRNSRFYAQYRKINRFFVNLFDRRISHQDVMTVAGTQLIGSNLNGIDYGVPLFVGGIIPDDMKFIFIPSHGEHNDTTKDERAKRSLTTHVTEVSFACGPKIKGSNGRSKVYKSLKILSQKAHHILLDWGHAPDEIKFLSQAQRVKQVFVDAYRPDHPTLGRIEKRAELYLNL